MNDLPRIVASSDAAGIERTLASRQSTHGEFRDVAYTAHALKCIMARSGRLNPEHIEALEMIATKIARIMHGNPDFAEHWHDIAGYATLAERSCRK